MTLNHQNNTINGFFNQNSTKKRYYTFLALRFYHLIISLKACLINDLEDDLESPKLYYEWIFLSKFHEKEVLLHVFVALLVKNDISS